MGSKQSVRDVEAVLHALMEAAGRGDVAAVRPLLADDLLLYKVGRVKRREDLLAAVAGFDAAGGATATYRFLDMITTVEGRLAVMTFRSRAEIALPGTPTRYADWLESVHLRHDGERWRIFFYHSTDTVPEGH